MILCLFSSFRYVNATEPSTPPSHEAEVNSEKQGSEGQRGDKLPLLPFFNASIPYGRISPDLLISDADLKIENLIGTGSFGKVYKGIYCGSSVAVKCFLSESFDVVEEIEVMQRVSLYEIDMLETMKQTVKTCLFNTINVSGDWESPYLNVVRCLPLTAF